MFFFFNDTATTEIYTLSLHDALPICATPIKARFSERAHPVCDDEDAGGLQQGQDDAAQPVQAPVQPLVGQDRKSTRLNSSHANISYAVFCLKKKKKSYSDTS